MKRIAVTAIALALTAVAGSAVAAYQGYGSDPGYDSRYDNDNSSYNNGRYASNSSSDVAQVMRVDPIYDRYSSNNYLRQECWNERTSSYDDGYYRDSSGRLYRGDGRDNTSSTVLGALIGGALGSQVGKGDGRTAATIGGAVIGGVIGNNAGRDHDRYDQYRDSSSGTVRRCRMVNDDNYGENQRVSGYNVTYRYAGRNYHAVTSYHPGRTMRVVVDVRPQDDRVAYRR